MSDEAIWNRLLEEWKDDTGSIDPVAVITHLFTFTNIVKEVPGTNSRTSTTISLSIPKVVANKPVSEITTAQRKKIVNFWAALTEDQRKETLEKGREIHDATLSAEVQRRKQFTHADEQVRVLYLMIFPPASSYYDRTMMPMTRLELDAAHLGSEESRSINDPYTHLADYYNDFEPDNDFNATCVNPVIQYKDNKIVLVNGVPRKSDKTDEGDPIPNELFDKVKNIDPSPTSKHIIFRDPIWLKAQLKEIQSQLGKIARAYLKSGNQSADNALAEWMKFCDGYGTFTYLAYIILDVNRMKNYSRELAEGLGSDTGMGTEEVIDGPEAKKRRIQEQNAKRQQNFRDRKKLSSTESNDATPNEAMNSAGFQDSVLNALAKKEIQIKGLDVLINQTKNTLVAETAMRMLMAEVGMDLALLSNATPTSLFQQSSSSSRVSGVSSSSYISEFSEQLDFA
jgi:hypothetical protein